MAIKTQLIKGIAWIPLKWFIWILSFTFSFWKKNWNFKINFLLLPHSISHYTFAEENSQQTFIFWTEPRVDGQVEAKVETSFMQQKKKTTEKLIIPNFLLALKDATVTVFSFVKKKHGKKKFSPRSSQDKINFLFFFSLLLRLRYLVPDMMHVP